MFVLNSTMMRRQQSGFTLIEALIAFVILSVGLLGIVSLQSLSKQSQHQSVQRARAISMADSIVERIRINPGGLVTYSIGTTPLGGSTITSEPSPNCTTGTCTPAQLATHDLWEWEQELDGSIVTVAGANVAGLVNPRGCIIFTADTGRTRTGMLNVIVQWRGIHESTDAVQTGGTRCGGAAIAADDFRRQVSINTFVIDGQEL